MTRTELAEWLRAHPRHRVIEMGLQPRLFDSNCDEMVTLRANGDEPIIVTKPLYQLTLSDVAEPTLFEL